MDRKIITEYPDEENTAVRGGGKCKFLVLAFSVLLFSLVAFLPICLLGMTASASEDAAVEETYDSTGKDAQQILSEIEEIYKQLNELEKKKAELNTKIDAAKADISTKLEAKTLLDEQVETIEEEISSYDEIIGQYDKLIAEKQSEIDLLNEKYKEKYDIFTERLRQSYEEGTPSVLEIVLKSDSLTDMLVSIERMSDILAYDNSLMDELEGQTEVLVSERSVLEGYQADKQKVEDVLLEKKSDLDEKIDESLKYVADLENDIDGYIGYIRQIENEQSILDSKVESAIEAYTEQSDKSHQQDYKLTKEYKEFTVLPTIKEMMESGELQKGSEYYEDGYYYITPIATSVYNAGMLTSDFGWRTYRGKDGNMITSNHKGIDICVKYGSSIYASRSGTVITAEYSSAYGNLVVILHDDGTQTRYAHASKILVKVGEYVLQGEEIAKVGSTGNATGNCCHFEIRFRENDSWTAYDPLKYITLPSKK